MIKECIKAVITIDIQRYTYIKIDTTRHNDIKTDTKIYIQRCTFTKDIKTDLKTVIKRCTEISIRQADK